MMIWMGVSPQSQNHIFTPNLLPAPPHCPVSQLEFSSEETSWHPGDGCRQHLAQPGRPLLNRKNLAVPYVGAANVASKRGALFYCWVCFEGNINNPHPLLLPQQSGQSSLAGLVVALEGLNCSHNTARGLELASATRWVKSDELPTVNSSPLAFLIFNHQMRFVCFRKQSCFPVEIQYLLFSHDLKLLTVDGSNGCSYLLGQLCVLGREKGGVRGMGEGHGLNVLRVLMEIVSDEGPWGSVHLSQPGLFLLQKFCILLKVTHFKL